MPVSDKIKRIYRLYRYAHIVLQRFHHILENETPEGVISLEQEIRFSRGRQLLHFIKTGEQPTVSQVEGEE
jgi:hypothetical protein